MEVNFEQKSFETFKLNNVQIYPNSRDVLRVCNLAIYLQIPSLQQPCLNYSTCNLNRTTTKAQAILLTIKYQHLGM